MKRFVFALAVALLIPGVLQAQGTAISELPEITADQIDNDAEILFGVSDIGEDPNVSRKLTLEQLKSLANGNYVQNVAALSNAGAKDGEAVSTLGYTTVGDGGGNVYYYDADSIATIDGGFVMPGRGGSLSFDGSGTFNGTAGTGRFIAVNQSVANVLQFGASPSLPDNRRAFQAAIDAALPNGGTVFIPDGDYTLTATLNIDTAIENTITIQGQSAEKTILRRGSSFTGDAMISSNTDDVANPTGARTLTYSKFADFMLYCQDGGVQVDYGIKLPVSTYCRFKRVRVVVPDLAGIACDYHYLNKYDQCTVQNGKLHGFVAGIETEVCNNNVYVNCVSVGNAGVGYWLGGGFGNQFVGCNAEQNKQAGMYLNKADGVTIDGYFEANADDGITFTTFNTGTLVGGPWTVKADIIMNGAAGTVDPSTLAVPTDVAIGYATSGVRVSSFFSRRSDDDTYSFAFLGARGINVSGSTSLGDYGKTAIFHAKHHLAQDIHISSMGDENTYASMDDYDLFGVDLTDSKTSRLETVWVQKAQDLPTINHDLGQSSAISGSAGSITATDFLADGRILYRLGDTAGTGSSAYFGGTVNLRDYPSLRGRDMSLVVDWVVAANYNDNYTNLYNSNAQLIAYGKSNTASIANAATGEVATTGTVSASSTALTVADETGLAVGDFVTVSGAGSGGGAHFAQITGIAGTSVTLSDAATTAVTDAVVRTAPMRRSVVTFQAPSTGSFTYGVRRLLGETGDAVYIARMTLLPFGKIMQDESPSSAPLVLPTSATGLPSGAIWNDGGTITIVP